MDDSLPSVSNDAPKTTTTPGKKKKGSGAKSRSAENFRLRKNEETQREFDKRIDDLKALCGWSTDDIFGSRTHGSEIPPLQVSVHADYFELIDETVSTLENSCRVPAGQNDEDSHSFDVVTLCNVVGYQLYAKQIFQNRQSPFAVPVTIEQANLAMAVEQQLDDNVAPIAVAVDQIGQFDIDGQKFYPTLSVNSTVFGRLNNANSSIAANFNVAPVGVPTQMQNPTTGLFMQVNVAEGRAADAIAARLIDAEGHFNPQFLANPGAFAYGYGMVTWTDIARQIEFELDFPTTVRRYIELKGRIRKKLTDRAFLPVHVSKARGLPAQLVMCDVPDSIGRCFCWSPRDISDDHFTLGAILKLGVQQSLTLSEVRKKELYVNVSGGIQALAAMLTRQLR